jgi:hypothetical protein
MTDTVGLPPVGLPPVGLPPVGLPPIGGTTTPTTPPPPPTVSTLDTNDSFSMVSGYLGSAVGGGVATLKTMGNFKLIGQGMRGTKIESPTPGEEPTKIGGGIGAKFKGLGFSIKELGSSAVTGAKYGAIIGGAVSALSNGYQVLTGKKTGGAAVGSFAADTISSTLSGAGGAMIGGLSAMGLSAFGMIGLPGTIIATGLGLIGATGIHFLTQKSGLYDSIKNGVGGMVGA